MGVNVISYIFFIEIFQFWLVILLSGDTLTRTEGHNIEKCLKNNNFLLKQFNLVKMIQLLVLIDIHNENYKNMSTYIRKTIYCQNWSFINSKNLNLLKIYTKFCVFRYSYF